MNLAHPLIFYSLDHNLLKGRRMGYGGREREIERERASERAPMYVLLLPSPKDKIWIGFAMMLHHSCKYVGSFFPPQMK